VALAAAQQAPAPQQSSSPGKTAKIDELLKLSRADQVMNQMMDQIRTQIQVQVARTPAPERATAEKRSKAMLDLIGSVLDFNRLKPEYVKLYDETFTEAEIDGLLQFYRTPVGQSFLDKLPTLTTRSMDLAQQRMQEIQPRLQEILAGGTGQAK
jgi:hypothetical protein